MNITIAELLGMVPAFALVLSRVGAAMALLPGLGELAAPASVRIGLALSITVVLLPELPALPASVTNANGMDLMLMIAGEVVTGLWFGWLARMIVLALPIGAQFIAYLIGISSVLQPDAELGSQSSALGTLMDVALPVLVLASGLYTLPLRAMIGLFQLIPVGHVLPAGDSADIAVGAVATAFTLALQLASPFVVLGIVWHIGMGQIARMSARMQIYFISMPGQILIGLVLMMLTAEAIITAWHGGAQAFMASMPGNG